MMADVSTTDSDREPRKGKGLRARMLSEQKKRMAPLSVLMGQPLYFRMLTSRSSGPASDRTDAFRGRANPDLAAQQWHAVATALAEHGVHVYAMPPSKKAPETCLTAGAGFIHVSKHPILATDSLYLRSSFGSRQQELAAGFERVIRGLGFRTGAYELRFAGERDFFPCGSKYLYTVGVEQSPGAVRKLIGAVRGGVTADALGSHAALRERLAEHVPDYQVHELRLIDPRFPQGDLVCCTLGEQRSILMVHVEAFDEATRTQILAGRNPLSKYIIPISREDAAMYAASSFQFRDRSGTLRLLIPKGVSEELLNRIDAVGVRPMPMDVSEWIKKDLGGVKIMLANLGRLIDDPRMYPPQVTEFRRALRFQPAPE